MYPIHLFIFSIIFFFAGTAEAHQGDLKGDHKLLFDLKKSTIVWKAHNAKEEQEGRLGRLFFKDSAITISPRKNSTVVKGEFVIDMNSIICDDLKSEYLKKHFISLVKEERFLSVKTFPVAKFTIQKVEFNKDMKDCNGESHSAKDQKYFVSKKNYILAKKGIMKGYFEFLGHKKKTTANILVFREVKKKSDRTQTKSSHADQTGVIAEVDFQFDVRDFKMKAFHLMKSKSTHDKKGLIDMSLQFVSLVAAPN